MVLVDERAAYSDVLRDHDKRITYDLSVLVWLICSAYAIYPLVKVYAGLGHWHIEIHNVIANNIAIVSHYSRENETII